MFIRSRLSQAEQAIRDLQLKGLLRRYDNKQLIAYLSADRTNIEQKQYFGYQAEQYLREKTNKGTIDTYESAIKALKKHCDYDTLLVQDIDKKFGEEFRKKLTDDGLRVNTISNYILRIKAIYNYAFHNGDVDEAFPRLHLKKERTKKRSL